MPELALSPAENPASLSVLTLNLRFGLAEDGPNGWPFRKRILPSYLEKYKSDFIAFQEVNDFQADDLSRMLPDFGCIGRRRPASPFWQHNLLFYRKKWQLLKFDYFFLSPTPDIPSRFRKSRWPRQCILGMFLSEGRRIICGTTHFDFDARVQTRSARLIRTRLSQQPWDSPVILMGDFNAPPTGAAHAEFTEGEKGASPADRFRNAFKPPFPPTHHGFTGSSAGDHIDWILYRGPVHPCSVGVIVDSENGLYPSDHFPVHGIFEWETAD